MVTMIDEATFAKITDVSRLLPDAPEMARGFFSVASRINEDDTKFGCTHLRPTNGRAQDQLRRNRSL